MFNTFINKTIHEDFHFEGKKVETVFANIAKSTILRLSYTDFLEKVIVAPVEPIVEVIFSDEEILCRLIRERAKKALSKSLYTCLIDSDLLPSSPISSSFQFVHSGSIGREIILNKDCASTVYIIVDGSIKFEVHKSKVRGVQSSSAITCKKKGERALIVKNKSMPIMLLEVGAIFQLSEDCFEIDHTKKGSKGKGSAHGIRAFELSKSTGSLQEKLGKSNNILNSTVGTQLNEEESYNLHLVFESPAKYLKIPLDTIRNATKSTSLAETKGTIISILYCFPYFFFPSLYLIFLLSSDINNQLNQINDSLKQRISNILPWIHGSMDWKPQVSKQ